MVLAIFLLTLLLTLGDFIYKWNTDPSSIRFPIQELRETIGREMEAGQFWLILLSGVALGLLLSIAVRWLGRKLLRGNNQKGGAIDRKKEINEEIDLYQKKEV